MIYSDNSLNLLWKHGPLILRFHVQIWALQILCLVLSYIVTWNSFGENKSVTCKFFQLLMGSGSQAAWLAAWGAHVTGEPLTEAAGRHGALPQNVLYHLQDTNRRLWDSVGKHNSADRRIRGQKGGTYVSSVFLPFSTKCARRLKAVTLSVLLFGLVLI